MTNGVWSSKYRNRNYQIINSLIFSLAAVQIWNNGELFKFWQWWWMNFEYFRKKNLADKVRSYVFDVCSLEMFDLSIFDHNLQNMLQFHWNWRVTRSFWPFNCRTVSACRFCDVASISKRMAVNSNDIIYTGEVKVR